MNTEDLGLSIKLVAQQLQTTELNVLMHIKRGFLEGLEKGGNWYVSESSLNKFLSTDKQNTDSVICTSSHCGHGCGSCQ